MQTSKVERLKAGIQNNWVVSVCIVLGGIVIGLSAFTNAARNLIDLVNVPQRPAINGTWRADVTYGWDNARHAETFRFQGEGAALAGAASFLGVPRGIVEGTAQKGAVQFVTKTRETLGDTSHEVVHRYRGTLQGEALQLVLQSEGSASPHGPVAITARKINVEAASPAAQPPK